MSDTHQAIYDAFYGSGVTMTSQADRVGETLREEIGRVSYELTRLACCLNPSCGWITPTSGTLLTGK